MHSDTVLSVNKTGPLYALSDTKMGPLSVNKTGPLSVNKIGPLSARSE